MHSEYYEANSCYGYWHTSLHSVKMRKLLEKRIESAKRAAKSMKSRPTEDKDVFADDTPTQRTGTYVKVNKPLLLFAASLLLRLIFSLE